MKKGLVVLIIFTIAVILITTRDYICIKGYYGSLCVGYPGYTSPDAFIPFSVLLIIILITMWAVYLLIKNKQRINKKFKFNYKKAKNEK